MRTLDEFNKERPRAPLQNMPNLRLMAQEAVRVDHLTGDEHWDHFLSYLTAALTESRRHLAAQREQLSDPALVNDEKIRLLKAHIGQVEARIWTLEEVMALPKVLKEKGEQAQGMLSEKGLDKK